MNATPIPISNPHQPNKSTTALMTIVLIKRIGASFQLNKSFLFINGTRRNRTCPYLEASIGLALLKGSIAPVVTDSPPECLICIFGTNPTTEVLDHQRAISNYLASLFPTLIPIIGSRSIRLGSIRLMQHIYPPFVISKEQKLMQRSQTLRRLGCLLR